VAHPRRSTHAGEIDLTCLFLCTYDANPALRFQGDVFANASAATMSAPPGQQQSQQQQVEGEAQQHGHSHADGSFHTHAHSHG
jgi:hypothetical protein